MTFLFYAECAAPGSRVYRAMFQTDRVRPESGKGLMLLDVLVRDQGYG